MTPRSSATSTAFAILPGSDDVYNSKTGAWDKLASGPNFAPNMAYIGWGIYVMARVDSDPVKQKAAWSLAAHLGGKDISLWMAAYPSGFQPYRQSHFNITEWVGRGLRRGLHHELSQLGSRIPTTIRTPPSSRASPASSSTTRVAEDELAKIYAGQATAQAGADAIAAAWEKITDQLGRDNQIKLYKASLGM